MPSGSIFDRFRGRLHQTRSGSWSEIHSGRLWRRHKTARRQDGKTEVEEEYEEGFARIMGIDAHRAPLQAIHALCRRDAPKKSRVLVLQLGSCCLESLQRMSRADCLGGGEMRRSSGWGFEIGDLRFRNPDFTGK